MSWLENIQRDFRFKCKGCGSTFLCTLNQSDPTYKDSRPCQCGAQAEYDGFLPIKMLLRGRVAFDQHGRKGYVVTDGKGNVRYESAIRKIYNETGDIRPQYTTAYQEHLRKEGKEDLLENMTYKEVIDSRKKIVELKEKIKSPATHTQAKEDNIT